MKPTGRVEALEEELARLRTENQRLLRLLEMSPRQARPPEATQIGMFLDRPGPVTASSSARDKVRFFRALFAARCDVYETRWENARTGRSGWVPAVAGGWRKGSTLKAAWAIGVPAALEVSRSGIGAHAWIFFTGPVPVPAARTLGSGLLREAIVMRGRMDLSSYDRLGGALGGLAGGLGVGLTAGMAPGVPAGVADGLGGGAAAALILVLAGRSTPARGLRVWTGPAHRRSPLGPWRGSGSV